MSEEKAVVPYEVRFGLRKAKLCMRRKKHARLYEALTAQQQDAMGLIEVGFRVFGNVLGAKVQRYDDTPRGGRAHDPERMFDLQRKYFDWQSECLIEQRCAEAAIDIICYDVSCKTVDRDRKHRNGWAMENLKACLDIYVDM